MVLNTHPVPVLHALPPIEVLAFLINPSLAALEGGVLHAPLDVVVPTWFYIHLLGFPSNILLSKRVHGIKSKAARLASLEAVAIKKIYFFYTPHSNKIYNP